MASCPLCGSARHSTVATSTASRLVRCRLCGLLYKDPLPAEFETQHQYLKRLKLLLPREGAPIREPHPTAPPAREFWQAYRCRTN